MPTAAGCEPWPRARLGHLAWCRLLRKFWLAIAQAGKSNMSTALGCFASTLDYLAAFLASLQGDDVA
jgi:hypothetical protein